MKSEDKLRKALDALFSANSDIKIEELRISDLWQKAGVSKATLYRYNHIVEEFYQKLEDHTQSGPNARGHNKGDGKDRTTVASLKKELNDLKAGLEKQIAAARQEIYVLHRVIEAKDRKIERMEANGERQKAGSPVAVISSRKNRR